MPAGSWESTSEHQLPRVLSDALLPNLRSRPRHPGRHVPRVGQFFLRREKSFPSDASRFESSRAEHFVRFRISRGTPKPAPPGLRPPLRLRLAISFLPREPLKCQPILPPPLSSRFP